MQVGRLQIIGRSGHQSMYIAQDRPLRTLLWPSELNCRRMRLSTSSNSAWIPPTLLTEGKCFSRSLAQPWGLQCLSQWPIVLWKMWRKGPSLPVHTCPLSGSHMLRILSRLFQKERSVSFDHLNMVEPTVKSTMQWESNGPLAFLDTLITYHPVGPLDTLVYRKKTHTDRYLDLRDRDTLPRP